VPLILVATPIGNLGDCSPRAAAVLRDADVVACEDTRRTRALLSHLGIPAGRRLRAVHGHNEAAAARRVVADVRAGRTVAYVSEAGTPGISDPGARLVRAVVAAGLPVSVVPGPSALIGAVAVSGFDCRRFAFEGFLPRRGRARRARIEALAAEERPFVCFEAPDRVAATLAELATACGADRPAVVVRELTKLHEEVRRGTLGELAATGPPEPRGEHVIVVDAAPPPPVDAEAVHAALVEALTAGMSRRDAAAHVATTLGVPRRAAYEMALSLPDR
jgi:16S rRNA (cytidine1402-2'-O)-methyltransferase